MKVEVRHAKSKVVKFTFSDIPDNGTILNVKNAISAQNLKLTPLRQSLRSSSSGKPLSDDCKLNDLRDSHTQPVCLYLRDLGPQVSWQTVFLVEYSGPLIIYGLLWLIRQPMLGTSTWVTPITNHAGLRQLALACWMGHYVKRLLETVFVHRFSHATMPVANLFKNCSYYFGFAAFIGYFVNHPLYTLPTYGCPQICVGFSLFLLGEYGNLCCHLTLMRLRPAGSVVRKIPQPEANSLITRMFNLVACPNYTYEAISWLGFSIMTQSLPALLFTIIGFAQMSAWAVQKLKKYRREFPDFPRHRKAIVPFLL